MALTNTTVKLLGEDGNVFNVTGKTSSALKRSGFIKEAKEYQEKAFACPSYNDVLKLTSEYVNIE